MAERVTSPAAEARRWEEVFTVLALDRFAPVWHKLGLPPAVVERPGGVVEAARAFLQDTDDADGTATRVEQAFATVARDYGDAVAEALRKWAVDNLVDERRADALFAWEHLLRRLCGQITDDGLAVASPLGPDSSERLCSCVATHFDRQSFKALLSAIEDAERQPASAGEESLDQRVRLAAGDTGDVLGVFELGGGTIRMIARRHRVTEALPCLAAELSDEERDRVFAWAREQGTALGFPDAVGDPRAVMDIPADPPDSV